MIQSGGFSGTLFLTRHCLSLPVANPLRAHPSPSKTQSPFRLSGIPLLGRPRNASIGARTSLRASDILWPFLACAGRGRWHCRLQSCGSESTSTSQTRPDLMGWTGGPSKLPNSLPDKPQIGAIGLCLRGLLNRGIYGFSTNQMCLKLLCMKSKIGL